MTATVVLFPHTYDGLARCRGCWQNSTTLAWSRDPRDWQVKPLCRTCRHALEAAEPLPPMFGETWEDIARLHQNRDLTNADIDAALRDHAGHLTPEQGWDAVECLKDAMLRVQRAEDPATVLDVAEIGTEHTPETYVIHCRGLVEDAVRKLVGAAA